MTKLGLYPVHKCSNRIRVFNYHQKMEVVPHHHEGAHTDGVEVLGTGKNAPDYELHVPRTHKRKTVLNSSRQ